MQHPFFNSLRRWDDQDRLTRDKTTVSIFNTITTLAYNGTGQLTRWDQGATTSKPVWDGQNILLETNAADASQAVYTLAPQAYGSLVSLRRLVGGNWTRRYYHFNALGTTDRITDDTQTVTDRYQLDPWGKVLATTGTTVNPFRFVGELGYYRYATSIVTEASYVRARHYDPNFARWWSQDPLGILGPDGANLYWYVRNRPTWAVDASGRMGYSPPCCNKKPYNPTTQCCENNVIVAKVPIWICERPLDVGSELYGLLLYCSPLNYITPYSLDQSHTYVCCNGENSGCFGMQSYTRKGELIPEETNTRFGECIKKYVCPSTKHSKCVNPVAERDYGIFCPGYDNCHSWAWCGID